MKTSADPPADHGGRRPGAGKPRGRTAGTASERYGKARADKEEALARLRQLEVAVKTGELLPADGVRETWAGHMATVRAHLLGLPARLGPLVAGLEPRAAEDELRLAIEEALQVISDGRA